VAATILGAQIVQLGVFARTYAMTHFDEHDELLERLWRRVRLEHGLIVGGLLLAAGVGILLWIFVTWAQAGFGALRHEYATALGVTFGALGARASIGSFFTVLLTTRSSRPARAVHEPETTAP